MTKVETLGLAKSQKADWKLEGVLEELRVSREITHNIRHGGHVRELPSPQAVLDILEGICAVLFPTHLGQAALSRENTGLFVRNNLALALTSLAEQVKRGLQFSAGESAPVTLLKTRAHNIAGDFARQLPAIRTLLVADLKAAYRADPSANSIAEILLCSRGVTAIIYHRIAHALHNLGGRLVARVISDLAHASTGIDIHPGARIAEGFFIDHGTGIVVGETAEIGRNVQISQGVTISAMPVTPLNCTEHNPSHRKPIIENDVTIHAGAKVLGDITVGRNTVVGGNVWLAQSVPPDSVINKSIA